MQKAKKAADRAAADFAAANMDAPLPATAPTKNEKNDESSHSESSREEELRITAMKEAILYEEKRRFKILAKKFAQNQEVDTSLGRCCGKYDNETGAKCVKAIDLIFLPNLPRWALALWATIDEEKIPLYARTRLLSCWLFWIISLLIVLVSATIEVSTNEDIEPMAIIDSLLMVSGLLVCAIVDYHYTRVVLYYAKGHDKRRER